ncbi:MAG: OmpA family protein [Spirochaetes bacterium]|nr:OmpA family protein [Spirochaetota bacterium]
MQSQIIDDELVALYKEIYKGNWNHALRLAESLLPRAKDKMEYALTLALLEVHQQNYQKAISMLEAFQGNPLIKEQIQQLKRAEKSKQSLINMYGKQLIAHSPFRGIERGIYHPDAHTAIFVHNGFLYSMNQQTGLKTQIANIGDGQIFGVAASLFPELFAVSVFCESRYTIKVFSKTDGERARKLEKAIFSSANDVTPFLSFDGTVCIFSSDRKPSRGGFDIFITTYSNGEWSPPQNAGSLINTKGNEINPWFHADSDTLFFASNGHKGFGGYDIYAITLSSGTAAKNIGIPVNDSADQAMQFSVNLGGNKIVTLANGLIAERPILFAIEPLPMRVVYGTIRMESGDLSTPITVKVDSDRGQSEILESLPDGRFSISVPFFENCTVMPIAKGYLLQTREFESGKGAPIEQIDFNLPKIYAGMKMKYTIQFDTASAEIPEREKGKLKELIRILQDNPHIKFEISGHSSGIGTPEAVDKIAKLRVAAVTDYLIEGNINPNRLIIKSYGAEKKITAPDPETAAQLSRRVEINVVSWDDSLNALSKDQIKFRLAVIRNELEKRRDIHLALPGYLLAGAALCSFATGGFYSYKCAQIKSDYDSIVESYRSISYASWKVQQRELFQQKLNDLEEEYTRYRKYAQYAYIAGGTLSAGAIILLVSDWFNQIRIEKLERDAEQLNKISFNIRVLPYASECAITFRF